MMRRQTLLVLLCFCRPDCRRPANETCGPSGSRSSIEHIERRFVWNAARVECVECTRVRSVCQERRTMWKQRSSGARHVAECTTSSRISSAHSESVLTMVASAQCSAAQQGAIVRSRLDGRRREHVDGARPHPRVCGGRLGRAKPRCRAKQRRRRGRMMMGITLPSRCHRGELVLGGYRTRRARSPGPVPRRMKPRWVEVGSGCTRPYRRHQSERRDPSDRQHHKHSKEILTIARTEMDESPVPKHTTPKHGKTHKHKSCTCIR